MGAKPIGAELWASFRVPPPPSYPSPSPGGGDDDAAAAAEEASERAADAGWNNLTSLLGGQFCASLSRLSREEVVVEPKLAFHPWAGSSAGLSTINFVRTYVPFDRSHVRGA